MKKVEFLEFLAQEKQHLKIILSTHLKKKRLEHTHINK